MHCHCEGLIVPEAVHQLALLSLIVPDTGGVVLGHGHYQGSLLPNKIKITLSLNEADKDDKWYNWRGKQHKTFQTFFLLSTQDILKIKLNYT